MNLSQTNHPDEVFAVYLTFKPDSGFRLTPLPGGAGCLPPLSWAPACLGPHPAMVMSGILV